MKVSVIIPAYNEEEALPLVLQELPKAHADEIIVVDNGSTDRTFAVAQTAQAKVVFEPRRGYGQACQAGLRAVSPETDVVVFLDGDHSDYPEELPQLLAPIEQGRSDLVIGSRVLGQAASGSLPLQQRFGNRLACWLIGLRFGRRFTDLGPFRAIRASSLKALGLRDATFGWNVEMQIKALKADLRIVEVPVRYRRRIGRSKISGTITGTVRAGLSILGTIARHW
jgi:glycosyltransferase involved in cell wall biosynthesis